MRLFVLRHGILFGIAILAVGTAVFFIINVVTSDPLEGLTLSVADEGIVESIVSVSGVTRSRNTAKLSFPTTGIVAGVSAAEGDNVTAGTILATLGSAREVANLEKAQAELAIAEANLENIIRGSRSEAKAVTNANVETARQEVIRIEEETNLAIANATRALYSNNLSARSQKASDPAPAPAITGTYQCAEPGIYMLTVYNSSGGSGYSMRVNGLEAGTYPVEVNHPAPFGTCGLLAQFSKSENYHNSVWIIDIPNTTNSQYTNLKNALDLAITIQKNAIASARDALTLTLRKQTLENASPLDTDVRSAKARVDQARATLNEVSSTLADRSIVAPFDGTITSVDILPGETAPLTPVMTLLATDTFEVIARVPEIDITRIAEQQTARITFDANRKEPRTGTISYIAPLPILIDGVAYFEVKIALDEIPHWLRGGLNADIDIVTEKSSYGTRIPARYLITTTAGTFVRTLSHRSIASTSINLRFTGNDGYMSVDGIAPGTTIVAP